MREKARSIAIASVLCIIVGLSASVIFAVRSLQKEVELILDKSPDLLVQKMVAGFHEPIPVYYAERIKSQKGVKEVKGRLWGYYYHSGSRANLTIRGVECPEIGFGLERGSIAVGRAVLGVIPRGGNSLIMRSYDGRIREFQIRSMFSEKSELATADLIVMCESDFRDFFCMSPEVFTDLAVTVVNPAERMTVAEKILAMLPDARVIPKEDVLRSYRAVFDWRGGLILTALMSLVASVWLVAWGKAMAIGRTERYEIGMLRALGWHVSDIIFVKMMESALLACTAFIGGILLAYIHVFVFSAVLFEPVLKGWSVLYPSFRYINDVRIWDVVTLFLLIVGPYIGSAIFPCWKVATQEPDFAMRGQ